MDPALEIASRLFDSFLADQDSRAPLEEEDFILDPRGEWSFSGKWHRTDALHWEGINPDIKRYSMVTTESYRCARLAIVQAETLLQAYAAREKKKQEGRGSKRKCSNPECEGGWVDDWDHRKGHNWSVCTACNPLGVFDERLNRQ